MGSYTLDCCCGSGLPTSECCDTGDGPAPIPAAVNLNSSGWVNIGPGTGPDDDGCATLNGTFSVPYDPAYPTDFGTGGFGYSYTLGNIAAFGPDDYFIGLYLASCGWAGRVYGWSVETGFYTVTTFDPVSVPTSQCLPGTYPLQNTSGANNCRVGAPDDPVWEVEVP